MPFEWLQTFLHYFQFPLLDVHCCLCSCPAFFLLHSLLLLWYICSSLSFRFTWANLEMTGWTVHDSISHFPSTLVLRNHTHKINHTSFYGNFIIICKQFNITSLMLVREEREPVRVILLQSPVFPWWWRLSEAGAVKQWRILKPLVAFKAKGLVCLQQRLQAAFSNN